MAHSADARRASPGSFREADDDTLLARLRAGEDAAFAELVRREGGRMLAVAKRILRSEEEAHDALQDAFLAVFRHLPEFAGEARLSTWLHRIAINAALMRLRSRKRRREDPIEPLLPQFDADGHFRAPASVWRDDPETSLGSREAASLVRACIDRLPESHRTVLLLRDIEGLDTAETAAALGLGIDAVKMRLHRARQALRSLLEPELAGAPAH
jgi:RNA polymerase sigma-70 factor (ECF subfamily)